MLRIFKEIKVVNEQLFVVQFILFLQLALSVIVCSPITIKESTLKCDDFQAHWCSEPGTQVTNV